MSWRFWRLFRRRSTSSEALNTSKNSALAEEHEPPDWVSNLDRKSSRYSRYELIAACGVVVSVLLEVWDDLGMLSDHPAWGALARRAIGGFFVAVFIILEVTLGRRSASAEHKIRNWYTLRVAELNLKAEQANLERIRLEEELSPRLFKAQKEAIKRLSPFTGTPVTLEYVSDLECKRTAEQIAWVLDGAGWIITPKVNFDPDPMFREGVTVTGKLVASQTLIDELNKTGIDVMPTPGVPQNRDDVLVRVGIKPSPEQRKLLRHSTKMDRSIRDNLLAGTAPEINGLMNELKSLFPPDDRGNRVVLPNK